MVFVTQTVLRRAARQAQMHAGPALKYEPQPVIGCQNMRGGGLKWGTW
jgi:hypothetical protein